VLRFIEVINNTDFHPRLERTAKVHFSLGEVWINEKFVVSMRSAPGYQRVLKEGRIAGDLHDDHEFTAVTTNNGNITEVHVVVGDLAAVARRVNKDQRTLLKG
tara:strand:+ start:1918 stop:2226 length:309 start_codon:yes stop_codon:yes gene_type:complete